MLLLVLAVPVCLGLAAGCCAFWICCFPGLRRFALGSALWCAAVGPLCAAAILVNLAVIATLPQITPASMAAWDTHLFEHFGILGWTNSVLISFGALLVSMAHGFVVRRATFALFRIYLTFVATGVAVLFLAFLVLYVSNASYPLPWLIASLSVSFLVELFAVRFCYRRASEFRGSYPERWNWLTRAEYGMEPMRSVIGGTDLPATGPFP